MPAKTPPRPLVACAIALVVLLLLTGVLYVTRRSLGGWVTPLGVVAPWDLLSIAVAMTVGGAIARRKFALPAVALVLLTGLLSAIAAYGFAPADKTGAVHWLLRNTALQLALSALVAWGAAVAGERLAARRRSESA